MNVSVTVRRKEVTKKDTYLDVTISNNTDRAYTLSAADLELVSLNHRVFPAAAQSYKGTVVPAKGKGVLRVTLDWDAYCRAGWWS